MTPEILAAAERYRLAKKESAWVAYNGDAQRVKLLHQDTITLADACLATLAAREEEQEPVDYAWVKSIAPKEWEAGAECYWPTVGLRYAMPLKGCVSKTGSGGFYLMLDDKRDPIFLEHITTRGQVLSLLKALGITKAGSP